MLRCTTSRTTQLYAVYYVVFGSLAGQDCLIQEFFWAGPYEDFTLAFQIAQQLMESHQKDPSFTVKLYKPLKWQTGDAS